MEILLLEEITKAVCGQVVSKGREVKIQGISTDSRNIRSGDLFFALNGERHDGHQFISQVINAGAVGAVVSHEFTWNSEQREFFLIRVKNTTTALGDLAQYYRQKFKTKIIGITGSNGKTTTKEITYHLLSHCGPAIRSQKSFNNFIGVPLTIFEIENTHQYGVLEMGTNAPGEIRRLSEIAAPDVAVITNVSKTHLEGLGSVEGVMSAKGEILENLSKDGTFVYNIDNPWCVRIAGGFPGKAVSFGFSPQAQIRCTDVKKKDIGYMFTINGKIEVYSPVPGEHNIHNCLASFAVCHALGHNISNLKDVLASCKLPPMRIEQQRIGNITVINDAYNANPESVKAALNYLSQMNTGGRKVFVFGDMLELGMESPQLHREIGEMIAHLDIDVVWVVGNYAQETARAARLSGMSEGRVVCFKNVADITLSEVSNLEANDAVLIKGSRGMHMENIIEKMKEYSMRLPVHNEC
jgi:UDP-N-acetylmuramoyl-tripeptide--D-alanyl-D-alanine ligase